MKSMMCFMVWVMFGASVRQTFGARTDAKPHKGGGSLLHDGAQEGPFIAHHAQEIHPGRQCAEVQAPYCGCRFLHIARPVMSSKA